VCEGGFNSAVLVFGKDDCLHNAINRDWIKSIAEAAIKRGRQSAVAIFARRPSRVFGFRFAERWRLRVVEAPRQQLRTSFMVRLHSVV
jgi:hypothetical protein